MPSLDGRARSTLRELLLSKLRDLLRRMPALIYRIIEVAFSPREMVRKLVLVSVLQLLASAFKTISRFRWHSLGMSRPSTYLRKARSLGEWEASKMELGLRKPDTSMPTELQMYCRQLEHQAENYLRLAEVDDMYGLMFHLRSELTRSQAGGSGYARDGNVAFRKHRFALELISRSQEKVIRALHYIGASTSGSSGPPGATPSVAERLAFINETRLAFGRTALLLSGGAAFGFKHAGVIRALHRQKLLPRIISGTSAGSIAAAACCVCDDAELTRRLEGGFLSHVQKFQFFGVRRGASYADFEKQGANSPSRKPDLTGGQSGHRLIKNIRDGAHVLDQQVRLCRHRHRTAPLPHSHRPYAPPRTRAHPKPCRPPHPPAPPQPPTTHRLPRVCRFCVRRSSPSWASTPFSRHSTPLGASSISA
jgi:hypothetical protein